MYKLNAKFIVMGLLAIFLLAYGFMTGNAKSAAAAEDVSRNSLSVSGQGKIFVKPDIAYVTIGVTTEAKSAKDAQSENSQNLAKVFSALKSAGISEIDIRTVNYDLSPRYDYINTKEVQKQVLKGYVVTNQVQVTVRNVDNVGKVLDGATNAGANLSGGVTFSLSEPKMDTAYTDALNKALKNGSGKAETLAKGLGVSIGKPKEVVENGASYPQPVYGGIRNEAKAVEVSTPISTGQMEITATVSLKYEY